MATAKQKNSTYNSTNGRYVLGGTTEVSSWALEWYQPKSFPRDPTDIIYAMEKKYEGRHDLLGYVFYGDVGLWWVIGQYNGITDPFVELVEGKILLIPTLDRVKAVLLSGNKVGGVPSTRAK